MQKSRREHGGDPKTLLARRTLIRHPHFESKKIVVLSDIQFPWEDPQALNVTLKFTEWWRPDTIILNGDITDCYALSHYDKDPFNTFTTEQELSKTKELMESLRWVTNKVWLGGNHEDRWRRIIWREASAKRGVSEIVKMMTAGLGIEQDNIDNTWRRIFNVEEYGFQYWPYGHYIELARDNLVVTHGFMVSMHSAYSAKRHYERLGKSVIIGHTHRLGSYLVTNLNGTRGAWENGCLCRLDPGWMQFPNWQQGFTTVTVSGKSFHVDQIPILPDYSIQYGEKTIK